MNTKYILIGLLCLLTWGPLAAQRGAGQADVESIRIGYITRQLSLTPEESQRFWPVYNQYQDELTTLRSERREDLQNAKRNFDIMSDQEVEELVEEMVQRKRAEVDLFAKYHEEFKQVLPIRKVAKLYKAESEFTKKLLDRLQERREQRQNGNGRWQR